MSSIHSLISQCEELARLLPLMESITVIEYDGENIEGSKGLYEYLDNLDLFSIYVVSRVILCGNKTEKREQNLTALQEMFPSAELKTTDRDWYSTDFRKINVADTLVVHMAGKDVTELSFDRNQEYGKKLREIICRTSPVYYACFLYKGDRLVYCDDERDCLKVRLRLSGFENNCNENPAFPTSFCQDRQDYINMCRETISQKDFFFQCVDEAEHGCESCTLCNKYGKRKQCPIAQSEIAALYRQGRYVPKDLRIAHQWKKMAANQGYKPSRLRLAEDLIEGSGCAVSIPAALEIFKEYAYRNDENSIYRIIRLAEERDDIDKMMALPFIVQLAKNGNEDMVLRLSNAFQNGEFGLPKDIVQQEEWIRQGAENGNPRFVKAMFEMYEAAGMWAEAYSWYRHLAEVWSEIISEDKMEELGLKMLTDGASDQSIALKGMDYLYGYHGIDRDLHLASRCLNYASGKGISLATGLLGKMHYHGIGDSPNVNTGIDLIYRAANEGDILSLEILIFTFSGHSMPIDKITEDIAGAILKDDPIAYYLKGKCLRKGKIFPQDDCQAFTMMRKAAIMGYPPAQYVLSVMFRDGIGVEDNSRLYQQWLKTAADNGHDEAESEYGVMLFKRGYQRYEAFSYLKKASDKDYDSAELSWCIAQCYMDGIGTVRNKALAMPLYIREAERGNADAQGRLCREYFDIKDYEQCARWGEAALAQSRNWVKFNTAYSCAEIGKTDRAYKLYSELAEEGSEAAMNNLGCLEKDSAAALAWFMEAADKGDAYAQNNAARYFRHGIATEKDERKALDLYTQSANQGHLPAILELASMYRFGFCTEKNIQESIRWYNEAVEKGNDGSLLDLAELYLWDLSDAENAERCLKRAAEKGLEKAVLRLGEIYENGILVPADKERAIYWYRKAASKGNESAKQILKRLDANWVEDGKIEG